MNGTEKVRIIVFFGDISGFTNFVDAVTNDEVEYDPLMDKFDELLEATARQTGYRFTDTGDGFMCTVDLAPGHNCTTAIKVVLNLWRLLKKIEQLFEEHRTRSVAPDGFRMVGAAGYVKRKVKKDGVIILRGKHINRAHNYLDLARGKGMVCDDSFKQLISQAQAQKNGIDFRRMSRPKRHPVWVINLPR